MTSKAARRRGRPRREEAQRTPSGQISRSRQEPADRLATIMRAKHMGLTIEQSRDQRAESVIGALAIRGELSEGQYAALVRYRDIRADWLRAVKAPGAPASERKGAGGGDHASGAYIAWVSVSSARYEDARAALMRAQCRHRSANLLAAVGYFVERDEHHEHMVDDLRLAAEALRAHFGGEG